ncbi:hypothetical protein LMH81_26785, partial [Vibrio lentus]|uniref:hypothetical protein n=1 Tax=Vibrio lentus TaxID=136468 RepID=UPI001E42FB0A
VIARPSGKMSCTFLLTSILKKQVGNLIHPIGNETSSMSAATLLCQPKVGLRHRHATHLHPQIMIAIGVVDL